MKDVPPAEGWEVVILRGCLSDGLIFLPGRSRGVSAGLMCCATADAVSRPAPSHGQQISFSGTDATSGRQNRREEGTPLTDDDRPGVLLVSLRLTSLLNVIFDTIRSHLHLNATSNPP